MFKGLRTKIESEQKDQGSINTLQTEPKFLGNNNNTFVNRGLDSSQLILRPDSLTDSSPNQTSIPRKESISGSENALRPQTAVITETEAQSISSGPAISNQKPYHHQQPNGGDGSSQTLDQLRAEVSHLRVQLKTVIKERDDSNDQNGQLYQLIEKLRRNLESEKEINTNLQTRLGEAEKMIAETNQTKNESAKWGSKHAKSIDPSMLTLDSTGNLQTNDVEDLRKRVMDLQSQINDKNRQLKIRQQNLNDIKRHLQMEIADHAKTQEAMSRVQNQLREANQISSISSDSVTPQNGSSSCDIESNKSGSGFNNNVGPTLDSRQSLTHNDGYHETARVSDSVTAQLQYDNISCISRGSNSVDENDLHDHLHHSSIREINNEYLKNVLFRYMTSTDTETAKHLVKALSVMMNFTPEQTAAIKSAMNARSSWLRLK